MPLLLQSKFMQPFGGKHQAVLVKPGLTWQPTKYGEVRRCCGTKARYPNLHSWKSVRGIYGHRLHPQSDDPPARPASHAPLRGLPGSEPAGKVYVLSLRPHAHILLIPQYPPPARFVPDELIRAALY